MKNNINKIYENKDSLKELIRQLDLSGDKTLAGQMVHALGAYFLIIYKENIGKEILPSSLLPLKRASIRYWMHEYYKTVFHKKREILQYQENGVTNLSKFQDMSQEEWETIKNMDDDILEKIKYFNSNTNIDTTSLNNIDLIIYNRSIDESIERHMLYEELKSVPKKLNYITTFIAIICVIVALYFFLK